MKDAVAWIESADYLETSNDFVSQTLSALECVDALSIEIDAQLSVPISQRNEKRAYELPFELKSEVVTLRNATDLLRNHLAMATSLAGVLDTVQQRAWEVREFGGRARTYFAIATATRAAIPKIYLGSIDLDNQRAKEAWQSLKNVVRSSDISQSLAQGIRSADAFYFDKYVPEIERMLDVSAGPSADSERRHSMEFSEFFKISNEALGMMEK